MNGAVLNSSDSLAEEIGSSEEEREGGRDEPDEIEEPCIRKVASHPEITGEGKGHRVHRKGRREPEPREEFFTLGFFIGKCVGVFENVAVSGDFEGEVKKSGGVFFKGEFGFGGGRENYSSSGSRLYEKELFDEPDTAHASDAANAKRESVLRLIAVLSFNKCFEPIGVWGFEWAVTNRSADLAVLELVEFVETFPDEKLVHEAASCAAKIRLTGCRDEKGVAVLAGGFLH